MKKVQNKVKFALIMASVVLLISIGSGVFLFLNNPQAPAATQATTTQTTPTITTTTQAKPTITTQAKPTIQPVNVRFVNGKFHAEWRLDLVDGDSGLYTAKDFLEQKPIIRGMFVAMWISPVTNMLLYSTHFVDESVKGADQTWIGVVNQIVYTKNSVVIYTSV